MTPEEPNRRAAASPARAPARVGRGAAKELPAARRELVTILERVERDERYRARRRRPRVDAARRGHRADAGRRRPPSGQARVVSLETAAFRSSQVSPPGSCTTSWPRPVRPRRGTGCSARRDGWLSGLVRLVARVSPDWEEAPGIAAQAAALAIAPLRSVTMTTVQRTCARAVSAPRARRGAAGLPRRGGGAGADRRGRGGRRGARRARRPRTVPPPCAATRAAATLAEAASTAAARLVHVNLATRPDDELTTRADLAASRRVRRARGRTQAT